jgi:hypothetical protein
VPCKPGRDVTLLQRQCALCFRSIKTAGPSSSHSSGEAKELPYSCPGGQHFQQQQLCFALSLDGIFPKVGQLTSPPIDTSQLSWLRCALNVLLAGLHQQHHQQPETGSVQLSCCICGRSQGGQRRKSGAPSWQLHRVAGARLKLGRHQEAAAEWMRAGP